VTLDPNNHAQLAELMPISPSDPEHRYRIQRRHEIERWRATQSTYFGDPVEVGECWETRDERGRLR